jgi:hypothetical protein
MDTAARAVTYDGLRVQDLPGAPALTATARSLPVIATYLLSEAGRKALLLSGGNGHALQHIEIPVTTNRLHLVTVSNRGIARLKLRPRFERNAQQRVVLIDAPITFDAPPTPEELLREAARNHQLERAYYAERTAAAARRSETDRSRRVEVAQTFLRDAAQRALIHPPPSPKRCILATPFGRLRFDVDIDDPPARDVPREALRRFRADVKVARERRGRERAEHLNVHEARKQAVAGWVALHGTPEQRVRHAAGLLPLHEVVEAIADEIFRPLSHLAPYMRDGAARVQDHLRQFPQFSDVVITPLDLAVSTRVLPTATSTQWASLQDIQAVLPDARVALHERTLVWKGDAKAPKLRLVTVVVIKKLGPFTLRREFLLPEPAACSPNRSVESE